MKQRMKTMLRGFGKALSVYPATNYADFVPKESAEDRMRGHWERTGSHIRTAISQFENEQRQRAD